MRVLNVLKLNNYPQSILILLATLSLNSYSLNFDYLDFARKEFGAKGEDTYFFLKNICNDCVKLVKNPGIIYYLEDIKLIDEFRFKSIKTADQLHLSLKKIIGKDTYYRAIALTEKDWLNIKLQGGLRSHGQQITKDFKANILEHLLNNTPQSRSSIMSLTKYPELALSVAKGYVPKNLPGVFNNEYKVYLFEVEASKLDFFGYVDTFGDFSKEVSPDANSTLVIQNRGEKSTISKTIIEKSGVSYTESFSKYSDSTLIGVFEKYDSKVEIFTTKDINLSSIKSVKSFNPNAIDFEFLSLPVEDVSNYISERDISNKNTVLKRNRTLKKFKSVFTNCSSYFLKNSF